MTDPIGGLITTAHGITFSWAFDEDGFGIHDRPAVKIGYPSDVDEVDTGTVDELASGDTPATERAETAAIELATCWVNDGEHHAWTADRA